MHFSSAINPYICLADQLKKGTCDIEYEQRCQSSVPRSSFLAGLSPMNPDYSAVHLDGVVSRYLSNVRSLQSTRAGLYRSTCYHRLTFYDLRWTSQQLIGTLFCWTSDALGLLHQLGVSKMERCTRALQERG